MNNVRQLFKFWQRNVDVPRRGALQLFPSFHLVEVDLLSDFSSSDFQRFLVGHPALCYPFHSAPPAFLFSLAASKLFFRRVENRFGQFGTSIASFCLNIFQQLSSFKKAALMEKFILIGAVYYYR